MQLHGNVQDKNALVKKSLTKMIRKTNALAGPCDQRQVSKHNRKAKV